MFTVYNEDLRKVAEDVLYINKEYFSGKWTKEKIETYQESMIQKTLKYAQSNSRFYKKLLSGINENNINNFSLDKITDLPFTTKEDLRIELNNVLSRPLEDSCFYYETTGTTGKATPCPRDYVDTIYTNIAITSCFETILKDNSKKHIVGVCGPTEVHSFGDTLGDVCRNMGLSIAKFWAYSPVIGIKKSIELLKELKITALMCTPGMALTMAKFAKKYGYDLNKDFDLEIIMVAGELSSPSMIKNLEKIWGVKAYNFLYGSMETSALSAVAKDARLYTFPLNYYYEVIDPISASTIKNKNNINYREGELVVTMLFQGSKPLIRYRTGDLVRIFNNNENAILPSSSIQILGRVRDLIILNGTKISAYDFEDFILKDAPALLSYQIVIDSDEKKDIVVLNIETLDNSIDDLFCEELKNKFEIKFNINLKINFCDLDALTSTGSMVSWKAARIIDKRIIDNKNEKDAAKEIAKNRNLVLN